MVRVGSFQTDLNQNLVTDIDPGWIAVVAVLLIVIVVLLALLFRRSSKQKREERELRERDLAGREREAQFEAAVAAIPYSHDPADAARDVAAVLGQYQQIRVLALYAGRQGSTRLMNILKQSPAGTGSLARAIMVSSIDAEYAASHSRPQFVPRGDFISAGSQSAARQSTGPLVRQSGAAGAAAEPSESRGGISAGPPPPVPEPIQQGTTQPHAQVQPEQPVAEGDAPEGSSENEPPPQGATTTPLDASTSQPAPQEPIPAQDAGARVVQTSPQRLSFPTGTPAPARGTGPLDAGARGSQVRGTGPLTRGGAPTSGPTTDSRPVGLLPWRGLFGWHGLLVIESREPVDLEDLDIAFRGHGQLTNKMSVALELERGITAAGSATDQSSRLVEFLRSAMDSISSPPALTETLNEIVDLMRSDSAAFWDVDGKTGMLRMVAAHGLNPEGFLPVPRGQGFCGWVAESGRVLAVEDAPADPKCLFPAEARDSGIGSYLGVPVFGEGQVEGVLEVHTRQCQPWAPASASALESAAIALSRINRGMATHTPEAAQDTGLKTETAYMGMSQTLESLKTRDEVIEATVSVLGHALGVSRVIAIEKSGQTGYLNGAVIKHEFHDPEVLSTLGAMVPEEFAGPLFEGEGIQAPIVINDSTNGSPMPRETVARLNIRSEVMVPLCENQAVIALIDIQECGSPREWNRDEIEFAGRLAHQASVVITHLGGMDKASRELEAARLEARRASDIATRARGIVDSVPEAIIGLDRDGRLTFFNAPGRVRYKLKNEDLGRMVGMVESLTLSDESIWEKVNASHGIVRFEATIAAPRTAAPLAAPDRRSARARNAVSLPISIAVAPVRSEKDEITGRILVLTDLSHTRSHSKKDAGEHLAALEAKMKETEEALSEAHKVIESAAAADAAGGRAAYVAGEIEKVRTDEARARRAAQQLLEINRLKSDFIVNAGRELDASLQSVLGFAELLGQGQYGQLTPEQLEAVKGIYAWARRMKNDLDWLIEYGSTRSRTLESGGEATSEE